MNVKQYIEKHRGEIVTIIVLTFMVVCTYINIRASMAPRDYRISEEIHDNTRRLVVTNVLNNTVVCEVTGRFAVTIDDNGLIRIKVRVGENEYKENVIQLNSYLTYMIEDLGAEGAHGYSFTILPEKG